MSNDLLSASKTFPGNAISPMREMAAWEALWSDDRRATVKRVADLFRSSSGARPSELVDEERIEALSSWIRKNVFDEMAARPGIRIHGQGDYPKKLRDAAHPFELLYFIGDWTLVFTPSVAVVGARKVSPEGKRRCAQLVRDLVSNGWTIISGLAEGVDTIAHRTCIEAGGKTVAVLGTPLTSVYPKQNADLQDRIARNHLLVSQVPFKRYSEQDYRTNRSFFPERNVTMSALSDATIIVEASETSGTLYQARAALAQKRKLFILNNCFENPEVTWPARFEKQGAIRVRSIDDVLRNLSPVPPS